MSKIVLNSVKHLAKLANLPITKEEEKTLTKQLSKIVDYIDQLKNVDTSMVEPLFSVVINSNVLRDDRVLPCLSQEEALANAPKRDVASNGSQGLFLTKGVFEDE